MEFLIER